MFFSAVCVIRPTVMKKLIFLVGVIISSSAMASPCEESFSEPIRQLRDHLLRISPNKKKNIQNLTISSCGENCLLLSSKTDIQFQIQINPQLSSSEITVSRSLKTLQVPSWSHLNPSQEDLLKVWLIGHEVHPYTPPARAMLTTAQKTTIEAFKKTLLEGIGSFLHIAPTSTGKTLVMVKALQENLIPEFQLPGLHFVTAHQIHLVDQLYEALQKELKRSRVLLINWNKKANRTFSETVQQACTSEKPVVFVMTTQTLKQQLSSLENKEPEIYTQLTQNTEGIYQDEAHHLGAFHTKSTLLKLRDESGAFFYGATATPVHEEVNIRELFAREHWSYLNGDQEQNLFHTHSADKTLEQLSLAIRKGEVTPFDDLYIIGESNFNVTNKNPLFTQGESDFYVLNPYHYKRLAGILYSILEFNPKGFIVTASIAEAERLAIFLNNTFEGIDFETYHSGLSRKERLEVLSRSKRKRPHYIVAVRALDEGVNLPHLSAYIDLNFNVSVKQMVHRIGRVLRLHKGKIGADIFFLADYKDAKKAGDLLTLLETVESSSGFSGGMRHFSGDSHLKNGSFVPLTRKELLKLRRELESSVRSFWNDRVRLLLNESKNMVRKKGIKSAEDFRKQRKRDPELQQIPSEPSKFYKNEGWVSWPDFLGTNRVTRANRLSLNEAKKIVQKKNIKSRRDFLERRKQDTELQQIPSNPYEAYENEGWVNWSDFLGTKKLSLNEAKALVRKKGIKTYREFSEKRNQDPELQQIPSNPDKAYKNKGWVSWPDFFGTSRPNY